MFACLSPPMDHMGSGNHSCKGLETLHHTCAHTSFILHIGVCAFFVTCIHTQSIAAVIILRRETLNPLLCFPESIQFKPLNSQLSLLLVCCLAAHTSAPTSLLLVLRSLPSIISTEISCYYQLIFYCCLDLKQYATKEYKHYPRW